MSHQADHPDCYDDHGRPLFDANEIKWPQAHITDGESVAINADNAAQRISDALECICNCWDKWEQFAEQEAQLEQSDEAYHDTMRSQLSAVLCGLVFDRE